MLNSSNTHTVTGGAVVGGERLYRPAASSGLPQGSSGGKESL